MRLNKTSELAHSWLIVEICKAFSIDFFFLFFFAISMTLLQTTDEGIWYTNSEILKFMVGDTISLLLHEIDELGIFFSFNKS